MRLFVTTFACSGRRQTGRQSQSVPPSGCSPRLLRGRIDRGKRSSRTGGAGQRRRVGNAEFNHTSSEEGSDVGERGHHRVAGVQCRNGEGG